MKIKLIGLGAEVVEEYDVDPAYLMDTRQITLKVPSVDSISSIPDHWLPDIDNRTFEQDSEHPHLYLEVK